MSEDKFPAAATLAAVSVTAPVWPVKDDHTSDGYSASAVAVLREKIASARKNWKPREETEGILSWRPDRGKTGKELADDLRKRLSEVGLKPEDVLIRYVDGQNWVHSPTAYTIGENAMLAMDIGVSERNATWASPFCETTPLCIGVDHPNSANRAYIVYRASDLVRIDRVGDKDVDRPFYAFIGNPYASVIGKIFDAGDRGMEENQETYLKRKTEPARERTKGFRLPFSFGRRPG